MEWPSKYKYPKIWLNKKHWYLHRLSYCLFNGPIAVGLVVRHLCNNSKCVNPLHLKTGTQKDNIRDSIESGTRAKGESHGMSKLNWEQVHHIRNYEANKNMRLTGLKYGVSKQQIFRILKGETWKD
jgi:hypothetical protein